MLQWQLRSAAKTDPPRAGQTVASLVARPGRALVLPLLRQSYYDAAQQTIAIAAGSR